MIVTTIHCDGCDNSKEVPRGDNWMNGGWREIWDMKHLCPTCIQRALKS